MWWKNETLLSHNITALHYTDWHIHESDKYNIHMDLRLLYWGKKKYYLNHCVYIDLGSYDSWFYIQMTFSNLLFLWWL